MKTNKKILAILIAAVLVITLLPSMAFADAPVLYNLWVGGVQVTSENAGNIAGEGITLGEDGYVRYDATSNTLELKNATITGTYTAYYETKANIYANGIDLTIIISGNNSVNGGHIGIAVYGGKKLTIKGGGAGDTLTAESSSRDIFCMGNAEIDSCTVNADTNGIDVYDINIKNSNVTASCNKADNEGIVALNCSITDSTVNTTGYRNGIHCQGSLSVKNSEVNAKSSSGEGYAVSAKNGITLTDAVITKPEGEGVGIGQSGYYTILKDGVKATEVTIKPDSVTEDPVLYNLWVGGVQVTSENAGNIAGEGITLGEGGYVKYDASNKTLTLNNATITGSSDTNISDWAASIYATGDLNVSFSGTNVVSGNNANIAIYSSGGKIEVTGKGSLTAEGITGGILSYSSVTITDCEQLTATGHGNCGIFGYEGVTIKSSTVTASNCNNNGFSSVTGAILIEDSKVIVSDALSYGIGNNEGDINIKSSTVDSDAGLFAIATNEGSISISDAVIAFPEGAAVDGGDIWAGGGLVNHVVIRPLPLTVKADKSLKPEQDYVEAYKIEPESAMPGGSISVSISMASNYAAAGGKPARVYYKTETDSETEVDITNMKTEGVTVTGSFEMPKDNVTIYAEWPEPLTEYTVKWLNGDGKELDSKTYLEGESEPVTDKIPVKAEDDEYTYTFDKWDSGTVEGTVKTYKPLFNSSEKVKPEPEPEPEPQPDPEPVPEVKPVYWVSEGTDLTVSENSAEGLKLTVHRKPGDDLTFSLFTGVEMDGKQLLSSDYTAASGSLKLTVKPSYIQGLKVGSHTLKVKFSDGEVTANVKVTEANDNPRTGDESGLWIWILIAVIAAGGIIAALLVYRKQSKRE